MPKALCVRVEATGVRIWVSSTHVHQPAACRSCQLGSQYAPELVFRMLGTRLNARYDDDGRCCWRGQLGLSVLVYLHTSVSSHTSADIRSQSLGLARIVYNPGGHIHFDRASIGVLCLAPSPRSHDPALSFVSTRPLLVWRVTHAKSLLI